MAAWLQLATRRNVVRIFAFFGKTTPYAKIFKILFRKFSLPHRSMLFCSNVVKFGRREIGEIVRRYLLDKKHSYSRTRKRRQIAL